MLPRLKRLLVGSPLSTTALLDQRLSKKAALAVFASDALSSSAYATEEILLALAVVGSAALHLSIPAAIAIAILLAIVVASYSHTIHAYPSGGGAYIVAKDNLGVMPGLVAAAALLIDYVLTVAVSIAAGVAAITSAFPSLLSHRVALGLTFILVILLANLRGVKESATVFGIPVYWFVLCGFLLLIGGFWGLFSGTVSPSPAPAPAQLETVTNLGMLWLFLRAFASGCTALTGVEAVSNGVQAFKPPVSRNASITLVWMAALLGTLFLGITVLANRFGIVPVEGGGETVVSQINRTVFGRGPIYYMIQAATTAILILAANTSFAGFPRLASILARDRFVPRQLSNLGDRLVFSNGILVLGIAASLLIVAFKGDTHRLIPLYMIGVFVSFTLSQAGMVIHWRKTREPGYRRRMIMNTVGALLTFIALGVVAAVKFMHGAWLVIVTIPLLVWLFLKTREHYASLTTSLSLHAYESPQVLRHTVIVPVPATPNRVVLNALQYAKSISKDIMAVHVSTDGDEPAKLLARWKKFDADVPLIILESPYRSVLRPLLRFIDEVEDLRGDDEVTVLLPEFVSDKWWHALLHNQTTLILKGALLFRAGIMVTSVPYHLRGSHREPPPASA